MKASKKVVLSFNESEFNGELSKLNKQAKSLTNALSLIVEITEGEVKTLDVDKLNAYLNSKTMFNNPNMASDALGVKSKYLKVISAIPSDGHSEFITVNGDAFEVDKEALRESLTQFMPQEYANEYNTLLKLVDSLNKHNITTLRSLNFRGDKVNLDPQVFATIKQMR